VADLSLHRGLQVLEGRCRIVTIILYVYMALAAAMALMAVGLIAGQVNLDEGAELDTLSALGSLVSVAYIATFIISVVMVGMWIYRGHANLRAAGADGLEFTPGWAVGWFFVPVANLFKPFQAMRELWNVSHAQDDSFGQPAPSMLVVWWACYLIGTFFQRASARISLGHETSYILEGISSLILIASAWYLLQIVRRVTQAQTDTLSLHHTFA
jgi:hypothetical protein